MLKNITNHYDVSKKRTKLANEQGLIFAPDDEWQFAHIPHAVYFKGRYYVMWASGHVNEDDVGQVVRYSVSDDFLNWEPHKILVGPWKSSGQFDGVLSPGGWHVYGDTLVAYFMSFEEDESTLKNGRRAPGPIKHLNFRHFHMTSQDGETFSEPVESEGGGGNHASVKLRDGRLFSCGTGTHSFSSNPDGVSGWESVYAFDKYYPNKPKNKDEEHAVVNAPDGVVRNDRIGLCEPSAIELDDGRIVVFYRSGTNYLWASISSDGGKTWSLPEPTLFTDNRTKFQFGRLPSGRFYYLGTPDPFPPRTRHVLALSLSKDGLDYDQNFILEDTQYKGKYVGLDKNGVYGYPDSIIQDGYLCIVFSICKERILSMKLPCDTM